MGMDVYGKAPTAPEGEYFRNSVWGWRPLAEFVTQGYPELTAGCELWQTNDGDGLDAGEALRLGDALEQAVADGTVARYARARQEHLDALPLERCHLCGGSGVRTDEVGVKYGLDVPRDPETGRGGCNGCAGSGQVKDWETYYMFSVENVAEFARFCRHSGGFEIW